MADTLAGSPIVAAVDGSHSASEAAMWAATEAAHRNEPLLLVHAVAVPASTYTGGFGLSGDYLGALEDEGRQYLAEEKAAIAKVHPELTVHTELRTGDPLPALVAESRSARLIALGSRGLGGFSGILAGSTAVGLVAHGHCPVAVIRGRDADSAPPTDGPVVVGVDGSPASEAAVALAFEEASFRQVDLIAVHTWVEFASDSSYTYARQFIVDWSDIEQHETEMLAERLAGWQQKYPDVHVRRVVTRDRPARKLLELSAEAQLLVVGSRGRGGLRGALLGSTSQHVIYHASCPVLVARPIPGTEENQ